MIKRIIQVLMSLSFLWIIILTWDFYNRYQVTISNYLTGMIYLLPPMIIVTIIQYVIYGSLNPLYLFKLHKSK